MDDEALKAMEDEGLRQAEAKLRSTAVQLRAVADGGATSVFGAIGNIASEAEAGLAEFLAADSAEDKWEVYNRIEESRSQWISRMEDLHSAVADGSESQAPTEAPDPLEPACEYVDGDDAVCETSCRTMEDASACGT